MTNGNAQGPLELTAPSCWCQPKGVGCRDYKDPQRTLQKRRSSVSTAFAADLDLDRLHYTWTRVEPATPPPIHRQM
jgi:hypothetical protein